MQTSNLKKNENNKNKTKTQRKLSRQQNSLFLRWPVETRGVRAPGLV